ncbi:hypothetical protein AKJ16_DCAP19391 [Drosera capensis]
MIEQLVVYISHNWLIASAIQAIGSLVYVISSSSRHHHFSDTSQKPNFIDLLSPFNPSRPTLSFRYPRSAGRDASNKTVPMHAFSKLFMQ